MIWECVMVEWVVRIADMIPESLWWDISGRDMKCCHWLHISGTRTNVLCYVPFPFPLSEAWDESRQGLKKIMRHSSLYLLWKSTFKFEWLRTFPRNELSKCGAWSGVSTEQCRMCDVWSIQSTTLTLTGLAAFIWITSIWSYKASKQRRTLNYLFQQGIFKLFWGWWKASIRRCWLCYRFQRRILWIMNQQDVYIFFWFSTTEH